MLGFKWEFYFLISICILFVVSMLDDIMNINPIPRLFFTFYQLLCLYFIIFSATKYNNKRKFNFTFNQHIFLTYGNYLVHKCI